MGLVTRSGIDTAGGVVTASQQSTVRAGGALICAQGDAVADHGSGSHDAATIAEGSATVRVEGARVCYSGKLATCGHAASGSGNVNVGG